MRRTSSISPRRRRRISSPAASGLDRLDVELDNLRSALDFATGTEPQRALRAAAALDDFWFMRGHNLGGPERDSRMP